MTGSFHTSILKLRRTRSCEISNGACEIHAFRVTTYLRKSVWLWAAQTVPPAHLRVSDCRSCWTDFSTKTYTMTQRRWELIRRFMRRFAPPYAIYRTKEVKCSCCVDNSYAVGTRYPSCAVRLTNHHHAWTVQPQQRRPLPRNKSSYFIAGAVCGCIMPLWSQLRDC